MNHHARARAAALDHEIGESNRVEALEGSRLDAECARLLRPVERQVDNSVLGSEPLQLSGKGEPGWSGSDDQDIDRRLRHARGECLPRNKV